MQHMGKLKYRRAEVIISSLVILEAGLLGRCVCGGGSVNKSQGRLKT